MAPYFLNISPASQDVDTSPVNCGVETRRNPKPLEPTGIRVAELDFDFSATDVAVTVTFTFGGIVDGAVKVAGVPLGVVAGAIVPHCAAAQVTVHVTPASLASFVTVAVSFALELAGTVAVRVETETAIGGGGGGGEGEVEDPPPQPNTLRVTTARASNIRNRHLEIIPDAHICQLRDLCAPGFSFSLGGYGHSPVARVSWQSRMIDSDVIEAAREYPNLIGRARCDRSVRYTCRTQRRLNEIKNEVGISS